MAGARRYADSNFTVAGFYEVAQELGFELVPLMMAITGHIGTITADAYGRLSEEMFGMLKAQGPFDGVFVVNHGAGVS